MADEERVIFSPSVVLESKQVSENEYVCTQISAPSAPSQVPNSGSRKGIYVPVGPFVLEGWIDIEDKEIGVTPSLFGLKATEYTFGLDSGVSINMELIAGVGNVKVGKEGNELIARVSFNGRWGIGSTSATGTLYTF